MLEFLLDRKKSHMVLNCVISKPRYYYFLLYDSAIWHHQTCIVISICSGTEFISVFMSCSQRPYTKMSTFLSTPLLLDLDHCVCSSIVLRSELAAATRWLKDEKNLALLHTTTRSIETSNHNDNVLKGALEGGTLLLFQTSRWWWIRFS